MASIIDLFPGVFSVASCQFDFQVLANMHSAHALVSHVCQSALHRLALRINNSLLWRNNNFCFQILSSVVRADQRDKAAANILTGQFRSVAELFRRR